MDKSDTLSTIQKIGLLAVIRGPSRDLTLTMVEALVNGGVTGIEITYTTPNAAEVVKTLDAQFGERIMLGMGTLVEPAQAAEAQAVGARFLVSPHTESALAEAMVATGLPTMMGAITPSEAMLAHRLGSDVIKIFPGSLVGPSYLKALRGPFPQLKMMPTGGVNIDNVGAWFAAGAMAVAVGSELCPTAWAKAGRFAEITERAKAFVEAVRRAR